MLDPYNILKEFYCGSDKSSYSPSKKIEPHAITRNEQKEPWNGGKFSGLDGQGWRAILSIIGFIIGFFVIMIFLSIKTRNEYDQEPLIMHSIEVTYLNGQKDIFDTVDPECFTKALDGTTGLYCDDYYRGKHSNRIKIYGVRSFKYIKWRKPL